MRAVLVCGLVVAGCEPPPAPADEVPDGPSIEILDPHPGQTITLNDSCVLDTLIVVNIEGLEVVAPDPENVVDGQGHWHGGPDLGAGYCISWHSFCEGGDEPPVTYAGGNVIPGTAKLFAALTDNAHQPLDAPEASVEVFVEEPMGAALTSESVDATSGRRFHLLELVGRGAFGEVYLAEQDSGAGFRRKVALKILNEDMAELREAGRRMRDEARILGRLAHRHIVTVLDLVKLGDRWAILMDYVPGADLEHVLMALETRGETFAPAAALTVGSAVLDALDAAHHADDGQGGQMCVVHRDMKPSNVRLTTDGDVKVLDFGVARFSLDTREAKTRASGWIGTERYMAPERILMEGDTPAGDVYAAAATVLELLLGRPLGRTPVLADRHGPFVDEALVEAAGRIDADPDTVTSIQHALRRALAADPKVRQSAAELSEELEVLTRRVRGESLKVFSRRVVPTVETVLGLERVPMSGVLVERSASVSPEVGQTIAFPDASVPSSPTHLSRPPWLALALGGIGLLGLTGLALVIGGVYLWLQSSGGTASEPPPETVATTAAPAPEPTPVPMPLPAVEPAPAPSIVVPPVTARATPRPSPVPATTERIKAAQVNLKNASRMEVTCGDVKAPGSASVRITSFPPGICTVKADYGEGTYEAHVSITRATTVDCTVDGSLKCSMR